MALSSITTAMSESVEYVVQKRQTSFDYFKRVQSGKAYWLNVVRISPANLVKHYPKEKLDKRIHRWFVLGLSAGKLLELPTGAEVVRGLCQLLEEYEHHIHKETTDKNKPTTSFNSFSGIPKAEQKRANENDSVKPTIQKVGKQVPRSLPYQLSFALVCLLYLSL
jgi:hypothetical protein